MSEDIEVEEFEKLYDVEYIMESKDDNEIIEITTIRNSIDDVDCKDEVITERSEPMNDEYLDQILKGF